MRRWSVVGGLVGGLAVALIAWPAAWLAGYVSDWTQGRVQWVDVQGPWWRGSALLLLSAGQGTQPSTLLPSRLHWQIGWAGKELLLHISHPCCTPEPLTLRVRPQWSRVALTLDPITQPIQWPLNWLQGLGAPWNTLKLSGLLSVHSSGAQAQLSARGVVWSGQVTLTAQGVNSPLARVPELGAYRVQLRAKEAEPMQLNLETLKGPLKLEGQGRIGPNGLKWRATAHAEPAQADSLQNLLNLIGSRQGARSILSIG